MIFRMFKIFTILISFIFLTGFTPLISIVGPGVTAITSGNIYKASMQFMIDQGIKKKTGKNSLMLVTALAPEIGYTKAAELAKLAHKKNISLIEELGNRYLGKEVTDKFLLKINEHREKNVVTTPSIKRRLIKAKKSSRSAKKSFKDIKSQSQSLKKKL